MSKITVTKEYEFPEDSYEFEIDSATHKMYNALCEIRQQVRSMWKYGEHSSEVAEQIDRIYTLICNECMETGVEL